MCCLLTFTKHKNNMNIMVIVVITERMYDTEKETEHGTIDIDDDNESMREIDTLLYWCTEVVIVIKDNITTIRKQRQATI